MTKVMRYQLLSLNDETIPFEKFNKILWELQYETMQISNRAVQLQWEFSGYESEYKKRFSAYPDKENLKENLDYNSINSYVYKKITDEFGKNNTGNISITLQNIAKKFKNEKIEYFKGERSIPNFKKNIPIDLHKNSIKNLYYDVKHDVWTITLSLLSKKFMQELALQSGQMLFKILIAENSQRTILEKCLSEEYHIAASKLIYKNGKWFLNLVYAFENNKKNEFILFI